MKNNIAEVQKHIKQSKMINYYYKCVKELPIKENVAFVESRGACDFASNIFYTVKALVDEDVKVYVGIWWNDRQKAIRLIDKYQLENITFVYKNTNYYYKTIATAKYLFNDMVYNDKIIKKPGQIWVNLWHGTPLKHLEFDVCNNRHELGGAAREFMKTDYIVAPSKFMLDKLISSSKTENILNATYGLYAGYPRNEAFFDSSNSTDIKLEQGILDKEIFVYMPTWRGTFNNHTITNGEYSISNILDFFERNLEEHQILFVKLHNFDNAKVDYSHYAKVKPFPAEYEPYSFLNIADCLITDYSSIFFDFANTRKKIILFTYDKEDYLKDRGVYIPLDELPFPKANNYEELLDELGLEKHYEDSEFIRKYCTYDSPDSAKKLVQQVVKGNKCVKEEKLVGNGKKNVLIYDARFKYRDRVFESVERFLHSLDTDKYNYIYCYRQNVCKKIPTYLQNLPNTIGIYAVTPTPVLTFCEKMYFSMFHKLTKRTVLREIERSFFNVSFEDVIILDANKYDPFVDVIEHLKKR